MTVKTKKIGHEDGVCWYRLNGVDYGTGYSFANDIYGITEDGEIVDCESCKITEGDFQAIAVRNSIRPEIEK